MTAETDIAAIGTGQPNTALEVRTALTSVLARADGSFTTYVPTWTGSVTNPVIGNGTLTGSYVTFGKLVIGRILIVFGSTTTIGSGTYSFTLPLTSSVSTLSTIGSVYMLNSGTKEWGGIARIDTATTLRIINSEAGALVASNSPFTWAVSDILSVEFTYESI